MLRNLAEQPSKGKFPMEDACNYRAIVETLLLLRPILYYYFCELAIDGLGMRMAGNLGTSLQVMLNLTNSFLKRILTVKHLRVSDGYGGPKTKLTVCLSICQSSTFIHPKKPKETRSRHYVAMSSKLCWAYCLLGVVYYVGQRDHLIR